MKFSLFLACFALSIYAYSQAGHSHRLERSLKFPDVAGYKTMKCDLHQHTVFSDGQVWPNIRVQEALKDGLDAISLTEHLEWLPHKDDIPYPDRNRSYEIALKEAGNHNLLIIRGSEITRKMPPGHSNAIFIQDANKLLIDDSIKVFQEAKRQYAFIFWNHPSWISQRSDGIATLTDMHRRLIREKLLDGIEVVNEHTYSDEALQIALDNNLTIMGTSDIHGLIDWAHDVPYGHRPITLVFAKSATVDAIQEGLTNRRTVVVHNNLLIGRDEFLIPLVEASLKIDTAYYAPKSDVLTLRIENLTSIEFTLQNRSSYTLHEHADIVTIRAREKQTVMVKTVKRLSNIDLRFEALNAINAPAHHPVITLKVKVQN
jgi:predicted metal-dependent phosphoesterase TrpH